MLYNKDKVSAIKIAMRYRYDFTNDLWKDLIEMMIYVGKDVHNPVYVCPKNLKETHDKISVLASSKRRKDLERIEAIDQKRNEKRRLREMEEQARREKEKAEREKNAIALYPKMRGKFFGLVIAENDLEISVLQSVKEFMDEGNEMHHCVFGNGYYDVKLRPNWLILSAKGNGKRMETIEVNLKNYTIVQCRGKYNQDSEYHEKILDLLSKNMDKIKEINKIA